MLDDDDDGDDGDSDGDDNVMGDLFGPACTSSGMKLWKTILQ